MADVSISEVAALINRKITTIRMWDRTAVLPEELRPYRDERGRRYWTLEQIAPLKLWVSGRMQAAGLPNYTPSTEEDVATHLERIRKSKKKDPLEELTRRVDHLEERVEELGHGQRGTTGTFN